MKNSKLENATKKYKKNTDLTCEINFHMRSSKNSKNNLIFLQYIIKENRNWKDAIKGRNYNNS